MNSFRLVLLLLAVSLSGCASQSNLRNNLPVAEPVQTRFAYEIELGKLNDFMRQDIAGDQLGELLYRRGALYDALGLRTLARIDFNHALEYIPDLANAYNYLGIHFTVLGEYQYAYDAFDSVLELEPEHGYALLNRGVAAYYHGRYEHAQTDMRGYAERDPTDPYRVLWLYLAEHEVDAEQARRNLADYYADIPESEWAREIIGVYLGEQSIREFLNSDFNDNASDNPNTVAERLCEAYFYLGKMLQRQQRNEDAKLFFRLALSTNVLEFVEHRYASVELARMAKTATTNAAN
ncbi:lipoprotein NlpI [Pseudidiomarina planktonica]|uniref:Lipoprotein NlpI n=1 Tax=Pseudidiomarina planktonica TaxID=1323738 RepID=A0A1Y6EMS1_9GAMM|nr:lipoprotein NlpI [Pseudidiomarina planktonica]RUO65664.1 lipoprotein NlpI [Pseudidiomarina planktonica]SMQ63686.1 lipoprotein NlpI [Pseudidiomarina planktonica]